MNARFSIVSFFLVSTTLAVLISNIFASRALADVGVRLESTTFATDSSTNSEPVLPSNSSNPVLNATDMAKLSPALSLVVRTGHTLKGITPEGVLIYESTSAAGQRLLSRDPSVLSIQSNPDPSYSRLDKVIVITTHDSTELPKFDGLHSKAVAIGENLQQKNALLIQRQGGLTANDLTTIATNSSVSRIVPDFPYHLSDSTDTPNDPLYVEGELWGLQDCAANVAWATSKGSSTVIVAVLDTGIDYTHSDLADNMWNAPPPSAGGALDLHGHDFSGNTPDPQDGNSHGTHCAGIIGAKGGNKIGVVGVNWNSSLMAVKIFSDAGVSADSPSVSNAIHYAVDNGAKIINASWGSLNPAENPAIQSAILYAKSKGVLFVAAAGNDGVNIDSTPFYPACDGIDNIIVVGNLSITIDPSTDAVTESAASTSNYGHCVDLFAPGTAIMSTVPGDEYRKKSGTSQAAPFVAGACALLWACPQYQSLSYKDIKALLLGHVRKIASLSGRCSTGGVLDLSFLKPPPLASAPIIVTDHLKALLVGEQQPAQVTSSAEIRTIEGKLLFQPVTLGGEGSSFIIKPDNQNQKYDLDLSLIGAGKVNDLKNKNVKVSGTVETFNSPDVGPIHTLKVQKIEDASQ